MSLFVQDVFAEAKALGVTDGFVGTYADLKQAVVDAAWEAVVMDQVAAAEQKYEQALEDWAAQFQPTVADAVAMGAMTPWEAYA